MSIYALKVSDEMAEKVCESLNNDGIARFGWSYVDTADLQLLKEENGMILQVMKKIVGKQIFF